MKETRRPFPLVKDDEPIVSQSRVMNLYDNEDLITNIRGNYQEKLYVDATVQELAKQSQPSPKPETYAQEARTVAKEDIKRKRQMYLKNEATVSHYKRQGMPIKAEEKVADKPQPRSAKPASQQEPSRLSRFAKKLRQESYILAELPKTYQQPKNPSIKQEKPKNNYDFLKRSQIYNQKERQEKKERRIAQELNLTRFEG